MLELRSPIVGTRGVKSPGEAQAIKREGIDATCAEQSDMPTIGAKPPEDQSASGAPSTARKPILQEMISRQRKQNQRTFVAMCRSRPENLPYCIFQEHAEKLNAQTSQDIRYLALIDMKGCRYQQLHSTNSQLFRLAEKNAGSVSHGIETEHEYIQAAQQRLHEFAVNPDNAYAGIRFSACREVILKQCKQLRKR